MELRIPTSLYITIITNLIFLNKLYSITPFTLRALSMFFTVLPISDTGTSAADFFATVHFLYHEPDSFSNTEYYYLLTRTRKFPITS